MALKNLGVLSPEAVREFQKAKLLMISKGGEVWVEDSDIGRATEIMKTVKNPVDQIYRFHGSLIRMPKDIQLEQKWYGFPSNPVGRRGKIHIHEMAKPTNGLDSADRAKSITSVTIRKEKITLNVGVFPPSYAGIVMCDDDGIPLFEVTPFNIWVLFDPRGNLESAKKIYDHMLMFGIVLANHADEKSVAVWNNIWAQQSPEREKWEIKQFEDMVVGSLKREMKGIEDMVKSREKKIEEYRQALYKENKAMSDESIRLEGFKFSMVGSMEKKAREEWEKMKGLERNGAVRNIRVTNDRISFTTREIKWTPPKMGQTWCSTEDANKSLVVNEPIRLGIYEITIYLGQNFAVEITNQTKTLSYKGEHWHHPHVKEGNICRGNMTEALPTFAAKRDFEAIIMCMLKWLENVDHKDAWGKDIFYWIADDQKVRKEEADRAKREEETKAKEAKKAEAASAPAPVPSVPPVEGGNAPGAAPVPPVAVAAPSESVVDTAATTQTPVRI